MKFFFQADHQAIESLQITHGLRNFAQGLLVAAVDASYAMGWVNLTGKLMANPGAGLKKLLQKLVRQTTKHWFKHSKQQALTDIKIYDSVRVQLAAHFRKPFLTDFTQAKYQGPQKHPLVVCIHCSPPKPHDKVWG